MFNPLALAAPFALALPALGPLFGPSATVSDAQTAAPVVGPACQTSASQQRFDGQYAGALRIDGPIQPEVRNQARIEQHIIIRISPRRRSNSNQLLAQLPQNGLNTRFEERDMESCIPVDRIAGVQTGSANRLLLFLKDNRIVTLNLERSCRARDFYSGFYLEKNEDGRLCVDRDALHSRSGARCDIEGMHRLVQVRN